MNPKRSSKSGRHGAVWGWAVFGTLLVAVIIVLFSINRTASQAKQASSPDSPASTKPSAATTTPATLASITSNSTASPTTSVDVHQPLLWPHTARYSTTTLPTSTSSQAWPANFPKKTQLQREARQVLEAYYSLAPDDTTANRRNMFSDESFQKFVPGRMTACLAAGIPTQGVVYDELRTTGPLAVPSGQPVPSVDFRPITFRAKLVNLNSINPTWLAPNQVKLDVPIKIDLLKNDGSPWITVHIDSATSWKYDSGRWQLDALLGACS